MNNDLIQNKIHEIRGTRVMLDYDLAELYQFEDANCDLKRQGRKKILTICFYRTRSCNVIKCA